MHEAIVDETIASDTKPRMLFVDDDADLLETVALQFATNYNITTAASGAEGLALISSDCPFAVIVSDMEMGRMNGIEFLTEVRQRSPESIRVMMTAHNDIATAVGAVNDGHVFRFLMKPYRGAEMVSVLNQCVIQFRLETAERELLEKTLVNSIQMLIDILALVSPLAFGRANRIRSYAKQIANILHVGPMWEIELAGLLCQLGCITIPPATLAKMLSGDNLSPEETRSYEQLHVISATLINHIPRFERVSKIIARTGELAPAAGEAVAMLTSSHETKVAAILRASMDFDSLVSRGATKSRALTDMQKRRTEYNSRVLEALAGLEAISVGRRTSIVKSCDLNSTMTIRENVYAKNRHLIVGKGQQVTKSMRELIKSYVQRGILDDAISVYLPAEDTKIEVAEILPSRLYPNPV